MEFFFEYGYIGLFLSSFISATIFPLASEAVLVALINAGFDLPMCLLLASVGNTLGSMTGYWLGKAGRWDLIEKYLRVKKDKVDLWEERAGKYGHWLALMSWLPLIGDLFPICLGYFKYSLSRASVLIFIGKALRYVILAIFVWSFF